MDDPIGDSLLDFVGLIFKGMTVFYGIDELFIEFSIDFFFFVFPFNLILFLPFDLNPTILDNPVVVVLEGPLSVLTDQVIELLVVIE